jgi:hypothetical protein
MIKSFFANQLQQDKNIQKFTRDELKKVKASTITLQDIVNNANIKDDQKLQLIVLLGKPDKVQILKLVVGCVKLSYRFFYQFEEHHPYANELYHLILKYFAEPTDNNRMIIESVLSTVRSRIDLSTNNKYTMSFGCNDNDADTLYFALQDILFLLFNAGCYISNADRPSALLYSDSVFHHMCVYINKACHYEKSQQRAESLHRYLTTFIQKN